MLCIWYNCICCIPKYNQYPNYLHLHILTHYTQLYNKINMRTTTQRQQVVLLVSCVVQCCYDTFAHSGTAIVVISTPTCLLFLWWATKKHNKLTQQNHHHKQITVMVVGCLVLLLVRSWVGFAWGVPRRWNRTVDKYAIVQARFTARLHTKDMQFATRTHNKLVCRCHNSAQSALGSYRPIFHQTGLGLIMLIKIQPQGGDRQE